MQGLRLVSLLPTPAVIPQQDRQVDSVRRWCGRGGWSGSRRNANYAKVWTLYPSDIEEAPTEIYILPRPQQRKDGYVRVGVEEVGVTTGIDAGDSAPASTADFGKATSGIDSATVREQGGRRAVSVRVPGCGAVGGFVKGCHPVSG